MTSLAVSDLMVVENHARISDARVQEALGFGRINDLHRVIQKHEAELAEYGEVYCQSGKKPMSGSKGGRPTKTYLLTEEQAVLVCMFARTAMAATARRAIIDVFMRFRRGEVLGQLAPDDGITITKDAYIALLQAQNAVLLASPVVDKKPRKVSIPLSDEERKVILRLAREGLRVNEIARRTGRSNALVSLLLNGFRIINGGAA